MHTPEIFSQRYGNKQAKRHEKKGVERGGGNDVSLGPSHAHNLSKIMSHEVTSKSSVGDE